MVWQHEQHEQHEQHQRGFERTEMSALIEIDAIHHRRRASHVEVTRGRMVGHVTTNLTHRWHMNEGERTQTKNLGQTHAVVETELGVKFKRAIRSGERETLFEKTTERQSWKEKIPKEN